VKGARVDLFFSQANLKLKQFDSGTFDYGTSRIATQKTWLANVQEISQLTQQEFIGLKWPYCWRCLLSDFPILVASESLPKVPQLPDSYARETEQLRFCFRLPQRAKTIRMLS
jgi:hypothetical protein